jgi:AcrR family transcriptional regulator
MPRAGLSAQRVTVAAADLADEVGWHRLTLAELAARLGVRQPSLYKHVDSLEMLRRRVAALAVAELREGLVDAATGRAGRDALLAMADAYRDYARRYPGRYAASVIAPAVDDHDHIRVAAAAIAALMAVLRAYDLSEEDGIHAIRGLRAVMHGFVSLEAAGAFAMPVEKDESYHRLIASFEAGLAGGSTAGGGRR